MNLQKGCRVLAMGSMFSRVLANHYQNFFLLGYSQTDKAQGVIFNMKVTNGEIKVAF